MGPRSYLLGLALIYVGGWNCSAGEPQAEFSLKAGWVECTVTKDGQPVSDALIRIMDAAGRNFAEGETDEQGQGQFPVPNGKWLTVEIKTGKKTADPIRLLKVGAGIEPAAVLLSYGLRPCCRVLVRRDAVRKTSTAQSALPEDALAIWLVAATVTCALACAVLIIWMASRRRSIPFS